MIIREYQNKVIVMREKVLNEKLIVGPIGSSSRILCTCFLLYTILDYLFLSISFPEILINIFQYLTIALGLFILLQNRAKITFSNFNKWGIIFLFVIGISLFYAPDFSAGLWNSFIPFLIQFLLYFSVMEVIELNGENSIDWLINVFCLAGVLLILVSFVMFSDDLFSGRRFGYSRGINPNELMMRLSLPVELLYYRAFKNNKTNTIYLAFAMLGTIIMLCTGSKKSLLIFVYFGLYFITKSRRNRWVTVGVIGIISLLGLYAIFNVSFLYDSLGRRIEDMINASSSVAGTVQTDLTRKYMRQYAFQLFLSSPIFGRGCDAFRVVSEYGTYSHNTYVEILSSFGAIGFAFFFGYPLRLMHNFFKWKEQKTIYSCMFAIMIVFFAFGWGAVLVADKLTFRIIILATAVYNYGWDLKIEGKNSI